MGVTVIGAERLEESKAQGVFLRGLGYIQVRLSTASGGES